MRKQSIRSVLMILLGTFILAFGYYHINFQNNLLEGGFVGLSLLLKYVFDFSPAITILLFDLPFFILILFKNSPQFILRYGGTTGGEDLLCLFISKGTGISIGTVFLILDLIVLGLSSFFLPLDKLFYTILAVIVAGKVITWTVHFGEEKEGEQQLSEQMI